MTTTTNYYTLIASLPHIPRSFDIERVPISRIRLEQRLKMLGDEDESVVEQIQSFLLWDRQQPERTDDDVASEYERLMNSITNKLARDIVNHRMDIRTITCALRRRRLGLEPPAAVGQYVSHIRKNWQHPDFRLVQDHAWITRVSERLAANQPLEVERELLNATWNRWVKLADSFHFSFETILLYLARWEIVDRWTRLNASAGRKRFDILLEQALKLDGDAA
jgi:hypothetical protein